MWETSFHQKSHCEKKHVRRHLGDALSKTHAINCRTSNQYAASVSSTTTLQGGNLQIANDWIFDFTELLLIFRCYNGIAVMFVFQRFLKKLSVVIREPSRGLEVSSISIWMMVYTVIDIYKNPSRSILSYFLLYLLYFNVQFYLKQPLFFRHKDWNIYKWNNIVTEVYIK